MTCGSAILPGDQATGNLPHLHYPQSLPVRSRWGRMEKRSLLWLAKFLGLKSVNTKQLWIRKRKKNFFSRSPERKNSQGACRETHGQLLAIMFWQAGPLGLLTCVHLFGPCVELPVTCHRTAAQTGNHCPRWASLNSPVPLLLSHIFHPPTSKQGPLNLCLFSLWHLSFDRFDVPPFSKSFFGGLLGVSS